MICWHCGRRLMDTFETIEDPIGNIHKVHKCCKRNSINSLTLTEFKEPFELENPELFIESVEGLDLFRWDKD